MKRIIVPLITATYQSSFDDISRQLEAMTLHPIDITPWQQFAYKPDVQFAIAYGSESIFLQYTVSEKFVKAVYIRPNDPVYEDSCVEFFISLGAEEEYYNFEFNAAGTCLSGFGRQRDDRQLLPPSSIRSIRHQSILKPAANEDANVGWQLTLVIPLTAFHFHQLKTFSGMNCKVNFYKCGDKLPEPHFVVWSNVEAPDPDFHLRKYFGLAVFT